MLGRRQALALAALSVAMILYCALNLRLGTNITHFMPTGSRSELARISSRLTDSPLTRTIVLSIGASDSGVAIAAARELAAQLRRHPEVAWLRSAVDESELAELFRLYFPRRHYFLSEDPERLLPPRLEEPALRERARLLIRQLASPASSFFQPLAAEDPLGAFEGLVARLRADPSALRVEQGQFVTRDGRFAILLLGTRSSAFDSGAQGRLLDDLATSFDALATRHGHSLILERSAVGAFAVAAERSVKADVYTIAACSIIGVAGLFVLFVASLRGFLITSVPPLAGILVATTLGLLVFGELDGLTMAFGASLMGIAIDYSNHLLIHHGLADPPEPPLRTAVRLGPSLRLGALTTVASFVGLGVTAFPAFRQMSFFAITGVLTALVVSLFVLPSLLVHAPPLPRRSRRMAAALGAAFDRVRGLPRAVRIAPLALGTLCFLAIPGLQWSDDMSRLMPLDPEIIEEDRRVRERVIRLETSRFVIGLAADEAAAVALNDVIHTRLAAAVAGGALDGTRSLHDLLWSEELQRRNLATLTADADLYDRVDEAFAREGFRPGAFRRFGDALEGVPAPVLRLGDLRDSPLSTLVEPFVFELGDRVAVVTYLRGLHDADAVTAALEGLDGVYSLDQRSLVDEIYREFRQTTLRQILVGGVLVIGLLAFRYRSWRPVVAAALPSVIVALVILGGLSVASVEPNLIHVMSLIMVMGMGVDYGIFCVDSAAAGRAFGATLLSLLVSCLTTVLVFGTLAFSSQPTLQAIGVTTGFGILLSYLLAPLTLAAVGLAGARSSFGG